FRSEAEERVELTSSGLTGRCLAARLLCRTSRKRQRIARVSDVRITQAVPAAGFEPAAFSFSGRRSYRLSYTGRNQRRRQESNLRQCRVAADRRSRPVRRLQQARAGGGTRTHLVRATKAVPGPSSIAGLFKQPVLVSSQLDRGSEPQSPPE